MVSIENLSVHFAGRYLFDEISYLVNPNDRIGLTGHNGAGKSTMLKIIAGQQMPETGKISKPKNFKVGYLPQELQISDTTNLLEETAKAFEEAKQLEADIARMEAELIDENADHAGDAYMDLVNRFSEASERYQHLGGGNYMAQVEKILIGLGFKPEQFGLHTSEFSGGWRMRIELAKILLQHNDLLLLDEPTNHLDIESIGWLEGFLGNYEGAVVMVSHDKAFLDKATNRTIEIAGGKIHDYKANYSKYLILREERRQLQLAAKKNQDKYIEHTEELINKFKAKNSKASFAQSLMKKLDKLEIVELDDDKVQSIRFRFPEPPRSGKVTVDAKDIRKSYGEKEILKGISIMVERGEKVAFVGKNGEGKSTLSKVLAGVIKDYTGTMEPGHNIALGYYAQNQSDELDGNKTVFKTIDDVAQGDVRQRIRQILGSFLFSGDAVEKKVKVLSGGEKARLAMALLLLEPRNLLIMDEPTNHLDMRSKDMLKQALKEYQGTMIVVSHDRDFLDGLVDKVYEFTGGKVKEHIGGIYEFLAKKNTDNFKTIEAKTVVAKEVVVEKPKQTHEEREAQKNREKEHKRIANQVNNTEAAIAKLEKDLAQVEAFLADPDIYADLELQSKYLEQFAQIKAELDKTMLRWEELNAELEKVG
ncbi:MAG: ABC-F family ATP-binding cassette domain-containing protein [Sphingobacteriales bacterium JAD_PAG50586_3]|nr:MAG: ABC-F family ATP-binding cassette domain-containing protein [Sphingobacteriales bacterium JAD_PAG50586_3]